MVLHHSEEITVVTPEGDHPSFPAFFSRPNYGSGPGLILITEHLNMTQDDEQEANLFAQEGYVVLLLNLETLSLDDDEEALIYIRGAINHFENVSEKVGKIAIIGRGHGGSLTLKLISQESSLQKAHDANFISRIDCGVIYYPTNLKDHIDDLSKISIPLMIHLTEENEEDKDNNIEKKTKELVSHNKSIEIYEYPGTKRGFASPNYDQISQEISFKSDLAHTRSLSILRKVIGPYRNLSDLWETHMKHEFTSKDVQKTMSTMTDDAYVNHVPTMIGGGVEHERLAQFYQNHFVNSNPPDTKIIPISRTIGVNRLADEMILCFTHTQEIDWLLPGVAPTNKYVEIPMVGIIYFRDNKLYAEHIYWDQASVLVQIGLMKNIGSLPVTGAEQAKTLLDKKLPNNELLKRKAK